MSCSKTQTAHVLCWLTWGSPCPSWEPVVWGLGVGRILCGLDSSSFDKAITVKIVPSQDYPPSRHDDPLLLEFFQILPHWCWASLIPYSQMHHHLNRIPFIFQIPGNHLTPVFSPWAVLEVYLIPVVASQVCIYRYLASTRHPSHRLRFSLGTKDGSNVVAISYPPKFLKSIYWNTTLMKNMVECYLGSSVFFILH